MKVDETDQMIENNKQELQQEKSNIAKTGENIAKKTIQQATKDGVKQKVASKAVLSLGPLIPYIVGAIVVVLIIIAIIGIIGFFMTIPGLMKDKLNTIISGISDWWDGLYKNGAQVGVKNEDIVDLGNYIADMGYDLIGFGFIKPKDQKYIMTSETLENDGYKEERNDTAETIKYVKNGTYYEDVFIYKDGCSYNGKTGEKIEYVDYKDETSGQTQKKTANYTKNGIKYGSDGRISSFSKVDSSLLKKYAIANARNTFLRNDDENKNIVNFFHSLFEDDKPIDQWSKGLIFLYEAKDYIATSKYSGKLFDTVELKNQGKTLKLKEIFNTALEFDTDGWSGRYGLSRDFLISLHLATLTPELGEELVENFDTEVQVYLDEVKKAKALVKLVDTSSTVIGYEDGQSIDDDSVGLSMSDFTNGKVEDAKININDKGLDLDALWISRKEAARFYWYSDIDSPKNCTNGYDGGIADFHILEKDKGVLNGTMNFDNYDKHLYASKMIGSEYPYNKGNLESAQWVRTALNEFVKDIGTQYGFSSEDFYNKVIVYADGDTAVKNLIPEKYSSKYDSNDENWYAYKPELSDSDYWTNRLILKDPETGELDESAYDEIEKRLESDFSFDKLDSEVLDYESTKLLKKMVGSECIYQYGKLAYPVNNNVLEGNLDNDNIIFSHFYGGYCNCAFCSTFYNKYSAIQEFVNYYHMYSSASAIFNGLNLEEIQEKFEEMADYGDLEYVDSNDNLEVMAQLYEWEYQGEMYKICFYYNESEDENQGKIRIVLAKGWSQEEWDDWTKKRQKGCSQEVKDAGEDDCKKVKVCGNCKRYIKYLVWSLKKINDEDYKTKVPYIARVVNSWFRDTYFVIPEKNSGDKAIEKAKDEFGYKESELAGDNLSVIQNDDEFLDETGELWTKYIMFDGNYAVFLLNSDGENFNSDTEVTNFLNSKNIDSADRDIIDNYILKEYSYTENGKTYTNYGLWKAETDQVLQNESEKKANEILKKYNINVNKIPISKSVSELDSEGYTNSEIAWNAYGKASDECKYMEIVVDDDYPYYMKKVVKNYNGIDDNGNEGELKFYVGLKGVFNYEQLTEAQRGMTNSKIKYLFKNRKYYKYDGSVQRAYDIYNDWNECIDLFGNSEKNLNKVLNDYYFNVSVSTSYKFARDFDNDGNADIASPNIKTDEYDGLKITEDTQKTYDPRNPSLIDNIDLQLESLNAFSILENTPSADAEYVYRDLKELLVELDYFDKEDLVEPAKDVLEWVLPSSGSVDWPYRTFDKTSQFGTLIHSKDMYDNLNEITKVYDPNSNVSTDKSFTGFEKGEPIVSPATAKILEIGTVTVNNETQETILDTYYVSNEDTSSKNQQTTNDEENEKKIVVTKEQYEDISKIAEEKQNNVSSTFGKSYTTGYVKLEVIGKESIEKFESLNKSNIAEGLNAFYNEYYNDANYKSVCDSYTIYIEGIDLTGDLEENKTLNDDLSNTIIAKLFNANSNGQDFTTTSYTSSNDNSSSSTQEVDGLSINYYTVKEPPIYYTENAKQKIILNENKKAELPSIIKLDVDNDKGKNNGEIYVKAGTTLGVTGNANIKIIMKDKDNSVVENVEEYFEIREEGLYNSYMKASTQSTGNKGFSVIDTVLTESEWVSFAKAYASNNPGDGTFNNEDNLKEFYNICRQNAVNPEIAFVRAIDESALDSQGTNNYWGADTPNNSSSLASFPTWQEGLNRFCELYTRYQDPTTYDYQAIEDTYQERKACTDFGGCDTDGYGTPDTLQGIQTRYSYLGDNHEANDPSSGGMYYLYPWGWAGPSQYTGENKIIFEDQAEFEQKCGSIHGTTGGQTSNELTSVYEQAAYTAWQVRKMTNEAKNIFGDKAGSFGGTIN